MSIPAGTPTDRDRLYFRQLLAGRDFARDDLLARQMVNFVYLVGDRESGDAIAVDPAYGVVELLDILAADGLRLRGVLATHYHADHCGGDIMGYSIQGLRELLALDGGAVPVHVQRPEAEWVKRSTGLSDSDLTLHDSGDVVSVGQIPITLMHTPGHTPGSQCFVVDDKLVAGDTLFLEGCGRTDLPGSDSDAMYESLQRLAKLPDDTLVFPGHRYSLPSSGTMDAVRATNIVYKPKSKDGWLMMFGQV